MMKIKILKRNIITIITTMNTKISKNKSIMKGQLPIIEVITKMITTKIITTKIIINGQWKETGKIIDISNFIIIKIKRIIFIKIIFTKKLITDNHINKIILKMKRTIIMFKKISKASKYIKTFKTLK